jgi:hypothetical protein
MNRQFLGEQFDELVWSMDQIADMLRDEGHDELTVRTRTFVMYVDQLRHLNETYNRARRIANHEELAGLLLYPLDDHDDNDDLISSNRDDER